MKLSLLASSIVCLVVLAGCQSLGLRDITLPDQVPPAVKAEPRLVETPEAQGGNEARPRLGDVPFMPKDFSPKPVYDHYMNELEFHRAEAQAARQQALQDDPTLTEPPATDGLMPPQLPQPAKE